MKQYLVIDLATSECSGMLVRGDSELDALYRSGAQGPEVHVYLVGEPTIYMSDWKVHNAGS